MKLMRNLNKKLYKTSLLIREKVKSHPVRFSVRGISMSPLIIPGQKVVITSIEDVKLSIGNIVLIYNDNRLVLHRIIYEEETDGGIMFLTKGDQCDNLDDWIISRDNIIGVVDKKYMNP